MKEPGFQDRDLGKNESEEVPKIFRLLRDDASTEDVVQQLYSDYYSSPRDNEKLFLGIQGLLKRGNEGRAALEFMAQSSDQFAPVLKEILSGKTTPKRLENFLNIKRWGKTYDLEKISTPEFTELQYREAINRGYTSKNFKEFCKHEAHGQRTGVPQIDKTLDDYVANHGATFGTDEPTYLELIGPEEVLRLRDKKEGNMLLLGSLGHYSAHEFTNFAGKINKDIKSFVIDIHPKSVGALGQDPQEGKFVARADARNLPFQTESMEHVYSNRLFHSLLSYFHGAENIRQVFEEVHRVLKSGGSFVIVESVTDEDSSSVRSAITREKLIAIGLQSGFKSENVLEEIPGFAFARERGTAKIDKNGFAHYEHALIEIQSSTPVSIRFVKE
ncbi:MAG: class I SAM-dependent methyltransferase [Candidatus Pacebacteria bacterium]|nr:class I SAM-dependent methyltransferase [Candidatus Paceibacterota bacterium]